MKIRHVAVLVPVCLLVTLGSSTGAPLNRDPYKVPYRSVTPLVESTLARTAIIALRHVAQARAYLHQAAPVKARSEIDEARLLINGMKEDLSTSVAKDYIWIARKHLEFEPPRTVLNDLPPIFGALDRIETYIPTDKARRHLELAKTDLEKDETKGADHELAEANRALLTIGEELPLFRAEKYLTRGAEYLARKDERKADAALQKAEQVTRILSAGTASPLAEASENFGLAFRNYTSSRVPEAKASIEEAKKHLAKAMQTGNARGREEAGKLSAEVTELEKKIDLGGKETESALKSAWERSEALAERSTEYLSAGWQQAETTMSDENDLIEAKLHLSYAKSYQLTAREPGKAAEELDKADSYLKKAAQSKLVDTPTQKKLDEMDKAVQTIRTHPEITDLTVLERYDRILDTLDDLIHEDRLSEQVRELGDVQ